MEPKEKAQIYLELIKVTLQRWQGTQKNQWTFNAIFWTGILLSAPYLKVKDYKELGPEFVLYSFCIVIVYGWLIYLIQKTLEWDKNKYKAYRKHLEGILEYHDKIPSSGSYFGWWWLAQVLMTIVLLGGVFLFMTLTTAGAK